MFSPLREIKDAIVNELERAHCSEYEFKMGGKHPQIHMVGPTGAKAVYFSGSPSCPFAVKKIARNVRHALKDIGYEI